MGFLSYIWDGPLHAAIKRGDLSNLRELLHNGVAVDDVCRGKTPLMVAARLAHVEAVALLLAKGANPDAQDRQGNTPLMLAAAGWGCKDRAKEDRCLEVVKTLLEQGADVNVRGKRGQTALRYALGASNKRVMALLRERGATDACYQDV